VKLEFPAPLAEAMVRHCLDARPNEACGLLASDANGRLVEIFEMANASASPLRYSLDPKEQFAVYKKLDEKGWSLAGVFHSHTRTEAFPSPTDVREAREEVPYVIVSLAQDPPSIRAFRILKESWTDAEGEIEEIPVVVEG
jgi:[CysO sulfur-carrier protein]-S-L-cysteine hydrolase